MSQGKDWVSAIQVHTPQCKAGVRNTVRTQRFPCQGLGSIPGWGTKTWQGAQHGKERKDGGKRGRWSRERTTRRCRQVDGRDPPALSASPPTTCAHTMITGGTTARYKDPRLNKSTHSSSVVGPHVEFPGDSISLQVALVVKKLPANAGDTKDAGSTPGVGKIPWRRKWQPTPVSLPGESHGQRSLAGYCPRGRKRVRRD